MSTDFTNQNSFFNSTPMCFGVGMSKVTGDKLKERGCKKVVVIFDKGIESVGIPAKIIKFINDAGIETINYNGVLADPPSQIVDEAAEIAFAANVDGVVAIGGGSPIDAAKAVRVLLTNGGLLKVNRFMMDGEPQKSPTMPLIIIPTTAGTGSEATDGAMITHIDEEGKHWKKILECERSRQDISIIDPELAVGTPLGISMGCAFDVLSHAIESCMSTITSPVIQAISSQSIRLFVKSYKKIFDDLNDLNARSDMALACCLAGIAINQGYVNAGHAFGHALGSVFRTHHGLACGVFIPAVLEYYAEAMPDEILMIADIFGVKLDGNESQVDVAKKLGRKIADLSLEVGVDIRKVVPTKEECYKIIPAVLADYSWRLGRRPLDEEGCKWIIDRAYEY